MLLLTCSDCTQVNLAGRGLFGDGSKLNAPGPQKAPWEGIKSYGSEDKGQEIAHSSPLLALPQVNPTYWGLLLESSKLDVPGAPCRPPSERRESWGPDYGGLDS